MEYLGMGIGCRAIPKVGHTLGTATFQIPRYRYRSTPNTLGTRVPRYIKPY